MPKNNGVNKTHYLSNFIQLSKIQSLSWTFPIIVLHYIQISLLSFILSINLLLSRFVLLNLPQSKFSFPQLNLSLSYILSSFALHPSLHLLQIYHSPSSTAL